MCGLAGFVGSRPSGLDTLEGVARRMADTLAHRGPDDGGAWADTGIGVAIAHRRLSIIDLSEHGHQPMLSRNGRYVVAYNGEIYNFRELRIELEHLGHSFQGHSDTEVLLCAVSEWGLYRALGRLNGMFAFALWDRAERVLHLGRDRLGEKPLYYGWLGGAFVFGSELKALRAHPSWCGRLDPTALCMYFRYSYVPAPFSIYQGVYKLPPGCIATVPYATLSSSRRVDIRDYWSLRAVAERGMTDPYAGSIGQAVEELEEHISDAVRLRMVADVPVGAFLSGGIDSSTVVALMQSASTEPVRTFSIGFHERAYNEAEHAAAVARHLGTDHTDMYVTTHEAMSVIPELPDIYDEPFADVSQIPTFLVARLARQQVTVSLSGDGGDELFGGYNRYWVADRAWRTVGWVPQLIRQAVARGLMAVSPAAWDRGFDLVRQGFPAGYRHVNMGDKLHKLAEILSVRKPEDMYLRLVSQWNDPGKLAVGNGQFPAGAAGEEPWSGAKDRIRHMMYLDMSGYLPDDILVKVDRASMAVGLESRIPLLDHRLVEFAWRLPIALTMRNGKGKWLLRQVLYRHVPRELVERPKAGFDVPIGEWLRGPLRAWAEELLSSERLRREGVVRPEPVARKWREHLSGKHNWQLQLWNVLMFQAWYGALAA